MKCPKPGNIRRSPAMRVSSVEAACTILDRSRVCEKPQLIKILIRASPDRYEKGDSSPIDRDLRICFADTIQELRAHARRLRQKAAATSQDYSPCATFGSSPCSSLR